MILGFQIEPNALIIINEMKLLEDLFYLFMRLKLKNYLKENTNFLLFGPKNKYILLMADATGVSFTRL